MNCRKTLPILLLTLLLTLTTALPAPRHRTPHHNNHKPKPKLNNPLLTTPTAVVPPTHVAPPTCQTYHPSVLRQLHEAQPDVAQPNTANTTRAFHVAQSVSAADGVKFDRVHQHVVFDGIRPGSWDCQLMVSWPDARAGDMVVSASSSSSPHQGGTPATSGVSLDVYSASYNASAFEVLTHRPQEGVVSAATADDNGPFATWDGMMRAVKLRGANALSLKGDSSSSRGQDESALGVGARLSYFGTVAVNPGEYGITVNSEACASSATGDGDGKTLAFVFEMPGFESRDASVRFSAGGEKGAGVYLLANC